MVQIWRRRGLKEEGRTYVDDGSDNGLHLADGVGSLGGVGASCTESTERESVSCSIAQTGSPKITSGRLLPQIRPGQFRLWLQCPRYSTKGTDARIGPSE